MKSGPIKILVPVGSLGAGVREEELSYGLAQGAHAIATDAGSTDSGAAYLALGKSKNNRGSIKRDLALLMQAGAEAGIPVIVGTCGQAGGDLNLDWTKDIALEIAGELGLTPKIALLYSEQDKAVLKAKNAAGKIKPLPPLGPLDDATIDVCDHIVAAMGPEPYIAALQAGADLILGGRTTDTAVIGCFALMQGAHAGATWHAAKVAECGAQCTADTGEGAGVLISIGQDGFEVEPLSVANRCTPHSVSAHMLYENSNPFRLTEPGGVLDVTEASYTALDDRTVRVTGSRWEPAPYTMKLEGAATGQFQTVMLIGIQDPDVLSRLDEFHDKLLYALNQRVHRTIGEAAGDFHISLRIYGWNAVTGDQPPPETPPPREVGVLFVATAETQAMATQIANACNPYFFHFPLLRDKELPSYGFPFTPAEIERGPIYEFKLNHVVEVDDPMELVRTSWIDLSKGSQA
ncbi:acyclic terpene utilization AtuA family protein [Phenylobacterium sp.]|uniref:acyclic terpene utilization AtuA family protein n=1 Tax=Phenylobacterium sp. TaxID=1871053 RepID=UPI002731A824|nr:acyclic terpene utilization AtuA family protein [Phenylobacterium sp.]MDP1619263.1 acyclic terpene utilization AtuA family protein [Phenylobacterium sp.]MDP1986365.1 acyclic terpene utilization AtuA family protein [Phenylobacterium sp.]